MTFISPPSRLVDLLDEDTLSPTPDCVGRLSWRHNVPRSDIGQAALLHHQGDGGGKLRVDFRSWPLVIVIGLILAVLSLIDRGGLDEATSVAEGQACTFTVIGTDVNVRTGATAASPAVQKLNQGRHVVATKTVTNGFRQMVGGAWVLDTLLTPVPGTVCT